MVIPKTAALYGAGNKSIEVKRLLSEYLSCVTVPVAVENKILEKIGSVMDGMEVISLDALRKKYHDKEIDCVVFHSGYGVFDIHEIVSVCLEMGIASGDIYAVPIDILRKGELQADDIPKILTRHDQLLQLQMIDMHICDCCNLNCKGCMHFSSLAPKTAVYSPYEIKKNLSRLKELGISIVTMPVLGGEPLMHPQLAEILKIVCTIYPFTETYLATNGILLTSMTSDVIDVLKKYNIEIRISLYPAMVDKSEQMQDFMKKHGLKYNIHSVCEMFERRLASKPIFNGAESTKLCGHNLMLRNNKIGRCPPQMYTDYFNDRFGKMLPDPTGFDIFQMKSGAELLKKLELPSELCNYCVARDRYYEKWEAIPVEKLKAEDWFIKEYANV